MNRVSEITTGLISRPDCHAVRWVLLVLILRDVPHWKIVGWEIVHGEVVPSIVVPGSRGGLRELIRTPAEGVGRDSRRLGLRIDGRARSRGGEPWRMWRII